MSTIAAISTAPGNAGIGIIRLSGDDCCNCTHIIPLLFYLDYKILHLLILSIFYTIIVHKVLFLVLFLPISNTFFTQ